MKKMLLKEVSQNVFGLLLMALAPIAQAAPSTDGNGIQLSAIWALPFVGVLLSIALVPLIAPLFWHHHFGKVAAFWVILLLFPFLMMDFDYAAHTVAHALIAEYIPFVVMIGSLYIISGGIYIRGNLHGSPMTNMGFFLVGTILASIMGTTGAAMLLIRPLLRANDNRQHNKHVVIFFIFLVANIGGSLSPLGDPPLFLGFLKGVPFFWTTEFLWLKTMIMVLALLVLFYAIDTYYFRKGQEQLPDILDKTPDTPNIAIEGNLNFLWLLGAIGFVLLSGVWHGGVATTILGTEIYWQNLVRDLGLLSMAALSWLTTHQHLRMANEFSFEPILEVAKLFVAIFITIAPVIAMLQMGDHGPFSAITQFVHDERGAPIDARYFWMSGILSGFLDNAPTYLVFFSLAGGDVSVLTSTLSNTLMAISAGAVFMGALSYIGNAPNFMVKSIAEKSGVKMPSFFGYMAWSFVILLPLFALISWWFF